MPMARAEFCFSTLSICRPATAKPPGFTKSHLPTLDFENIHPPNQRSSPQKNHIPVAQPPWLLRTLRAWTSGGVTHSPKSAAAFWVDCACVTMISRHSCCISSPARQAKNVGNSAASWTHVQASVSPIKASACVTSPSNKTWMNQKISQVTSPLWSEERTHRQQRGESWNWQGTWPSSRNFSCDVLRHLKNRILSKTWENSR